jgi:hypothetical protein
MPITASQVDSLILCEPCYDNLVYEPAEISVTCGNEDRGYKQERICFGCQNTNAWRSAAGEPVEQPADALAAWDGSTLAERNAAIVDLVGEPVMREAGDRR